ncbi:MAG TPA: hypothetical protein VHA30_05075, partial [Patescibacteria group bacterium]|nr:hypothetical protein [Patescibacteria group bacterium]
LLAVDKNGSLGVGGTSTTVGLEVRATNSITKVATLSGTSSPNYLDAPYQLAIQGKYAFVVTGNNSQLNVIDITTPTAPATVGHVVLGSSGMSTVAVSGKYAYVGNFNNQIFVVDISKPTNPVLVSTFNPTGNNMGSFKISGKYLYIAEYQLDNKLEIVDISNPYALKSLASISTSNQFAYGVAVSGHYVYVTDDNYLDIYDVSNPTNPVHTASLYDNTALIGAQDPIIIGRYAYIDSYDFGTLTIVDISSSTNPTVMSVTNTSGGVVRATGLAVAGKYAYVYNASNNQLYVFDVSNPSAPSLIQSAVVTTGSYVDNSDNALAMDGKYLYLVTLNDNTFNVIDTSGISAPGISAGSLAVDTIHASADSYFNQAVNINGGLQVGTAGIVSQGSVAIQPAAGDFAFTVNSSTGATLFTVAANGNVGVGTATPAQLLQVAGNIGIGSAGNTAGSLVFYNSGNANTVTLRSTTTLGTNLVLTLPTTTPSSGQALLTDASGNLYWGSAGGGSLSGGTGDYVARWTSASTLSTGLLIDNGSVAGVNATSSSYTFNIQGSSGVNPFQIASSSGGTLFRITADGRLNLNNTNTTYGADFTNTANATLYSGVFGANYNATPPVAEHSVGVGTNALAVIGQAGNDTYAPLEIGAFATNLTTTKNFGLMIMTRNNSSWSSGSPTAMTAGQYLMGIGFAGQSNTTAGSGMVVGASIQAQAESVASQNMPTSLIFLTGASSTNLSEKMRITSSGSVGIGTTTPIGALSLQGTVTTSGSNSVAGLYASTTLGNTTAGGFEFGNRLLTTVAGTASGTYDGLLLRMTDNMASATNTVRGLEVQADNGTNTLGVNAGIVAFGKTFGIQGITSGLAGGVAQPAGVYAELDNATVGNALRAYSNTITSANLVSFYQESSGFSGDGLLMNFGNNSGSFSGNFLDLQVNGSSKMSVNSAGKVTAVGGFNGQCLASGSFNATTTGSCNMDVAEIYNASEPVAAGDVLVLDASASSSSATSTPLVRKAARPYDSHLLGAVSTAPGLILGSGRGEVLLGGESTTYIDTANASTAPAVALAGRVPVKVTNENGVIEPGDFLTSSALFPGYAMKATRSGYVLGQALEGFTSSTTNDSAVILTYVHPGFENINNTFVLGDSDGQLAGATSTEQLAQNSSSTAGSFLINQQGTGGLLQLQQGGADRLLIANDGSVNILASTTLATSTVLSVRQASTTLFSINAAGHITVSPDTAGTAVIKANQNQAVVTFAVPYDSVPKITVTVQGLPDFFYGVATKTPAGFTIQTSKPVVQDVSFDWVALAQPTSTPSQSSLNSSIVVVPVPSGGGQSIVIPSGEGTDQSGQVAGDSTDTPSSDAGSGSNGDTGSSVGPADSGSTDAGGVSGSDAAGQGSDSAGSSGGPAADTSNSGADGSGATPN